MPLFGFRKDKKHEQSHVQAEAGLAKNAAFARKNRAGGKAKGARVSASPKPEKIARQVVTKDAAGAAKASAALPSGTFSSASAVIIRPRVTEKSGILAQGGVYTFEVTRDANKQMISRAVAALYKVTPVKVAITNLPAKRIIVKGRQGTMAGVRKALVSLKKGEKIDFI
jgi:large subunit ribosomal protein L23